MSQNSEIKTHLMSGKNLTALDALGLFGCFRLASRINDLKRQGIDIRTSMIEVNGKRIAEYSHVKRKFVKK